MFFSTELIIALAFGEEKSENPKPSRQRQIITYTKPVVSERKKRNPSPAVVIAMPIDETRAGSILSENLPARGENRAGKKKPRFIFA
jgi:hypothetical protein